MSGKQRASDREQGIPEPKRNRTTVDPQHQPWSALMEAAAEGAGGGGGGPGVPGPPPPPIAVDPAAGLGCWIVGVKKLPARTASGGADHNDWQEMCQHVADNGPNFVGQKGLEMECVLRCILVEVGLSQCGGEINSLAEYVCALIGHGLRATLDPDRTHWASNAEFLAWLRKHATYDSWLDLYKSMGVHTAAADGRSGSTSVGQAWNTVLAAAVSKTLFGPPAAAGGGGGGGAADPPGEVAEPPAEQLRTLLAKGNNNLRLRARMELMMWSAKADTLNMFSPGVYTAYTNKELCDYEYLIWRDAFEPSDEVKGHIVATDTMACKTVAKVWEQRLQGIGLEVGEHKWIEVMRSERANPFSLLSQTLGAEGAPAYHTLQHGNLLYLLLAAQRQMNTPQDPWCARRLLFKNLYHLVVDNEYDRQPMTVAQQFEYSMVVVRFSSMAEWWHVYAGANLKGYRPSVKYKDHCRYKWSAELKTMVRHAIFYFGDEYGRYLVRNTLLRELTLRKATKSWIKDVTQLVTGDYEPRIFLAIDALKRTADITAQTKLAWKAVVQRLRNGYVQSDEASANLRKVDDMASSILLHIEFASQQPNVKEFFGDYASKDLVRWLVLGNVRHMLGPGPTEAQVQWATRHLQHLLPARSWEGHMRKLGPHVPAMWQEVQQYFAVAGPVWGPEMNTIQRNWLRILDMLDATYRTYTKSVIHHHVLPHLLRLFDICGLYSRQHMWVRWLSWCMPERMQPPSVQGQLKK